MHGADGRGLSDGDADDEDVDEKGEEGGGIYIYILTYVCLYFLCVLYIAHTGFYILIFYI